jgi:hypothetical protein
MKVQEKMKTYGSNTLTDSELVSLIIGKRVKDRTAVEVADKVMESLPRPNLYYLGETCVQDLEAIYGVGEKSALALCAAIELLVCGHRTRETYPPVVSETQRSRFQQSPKCSVVSHGRNAILIARRIPCCLPYDKESADCCADHQQRFYQRQHRQRP